MATSTSTDRGRQATCVHCLIRSPRRPAVAAAPPGLDGSAPLRVLDGGDGLWLVVSDVALERYDADAIEAGLHDIDWVARHALAHERVVEHFLDGGALIPMKLFTLYHGDERALDSLTARRAALEGAFDEVQGRHEWGVRMLAAPAPTRPAARDGAPPSGRPGTDFLRRKQSARRASVEAAAGLLAAAEELYRELADVAARAHRSELPPEAVGARLLIDAAYLVSTRRTTRFHTAVDAGRARAAERGLEVVLTGPWPAYHFIEAPE